MPRGYNKWERAGMAFSDMGESLGRLAYMQAMMQNAKDDNERAEAKLAYDKEALKVKTYQDLLPGVKEYGASPEQQNMMAQGLGLSPDLSQGPTLQRIPGVQTPEEKLEFGAKKSYAESLAKTYGEKLATYESPFAAEPEALRQTLRTEATSDFRKQQFAEADAAIYQSDRISAHLKKSRANMCDELGLSPKECAKFQADGKLPETLTDNQIITALGEARKVGVAIATIPNIDYQTAAGEYQKMLATEGEGSLKTENAKREMERYEYLLNFFKENGVYALPENRWLVEEATKRGLMSPEQAANMNAEGGPTEPTAENDSILLQENLRKQAEIRRRMQTPAQGALGGGY